MAGSVSLFLILYSLSVQLLFHRYLCGSGNNHITSPISYISQLHRIYSPELQSYILYYYITKRSNMIHIGETNLSPGFIIRGSSRANVTFHSLPFALVFSDERVRKALEQRLVFRAGCLHPLSLHMYICFVFSVVLHKESFTEILDCYCCLS